MPRYFTVFQTEGDRYSIGCQKQITASLCSETVIYTKEVDEKHNKAAQTEWKTRCFDDL